MDSDKDEKFRSKDAEQGNVRMLRGMKPCRYTYPLDYVAKFQVHLEGFENLEPLEIDYLRTLEAGLDYLSALVKEKEAQASNTDHPWDDVADWKVITCAFNWYSVTACDYVKTVGRLVYPGDKKKVKEYLNRVIPLVYHWRDKVGAHATFAPTPFEGLIKFKIKDTDDVDLTHTKFVKAAKNQVFNQLPVPGINFVDNLFVAGILLGMPSPSADMHVEDMTWSLTRTHQELSRRYWPRKY